MMGASLIHGLAVDKLSRKAHSKDLISNDLFISVRDVRLVLGSELRIPKCFQTRFVRELVDEGLLEVVDKRNVKIIKH